MSNRVLHIGSHRTGTSSLQKFLQENKEFLAARQIEFLCPPDSRVGSTLDCVAAKVSQWQKNGATKILISEENLLGTMENNIAEESLYPNARYNLARLQQIFQPDILLFSLRELSDYWNSAVLFSFSRDAIQFPNEKKIASLANCSRSWKHVLDDVASVFPKAKLVVREFNYFKDNPKKFLRLSTGWSEWGETKLQRRPHNQRPSDDMVVTKLLEKKDFHGLLRLGAKEGGDLFSNAQKMELYERYQNDLDSIRRLCGSSFLETEEGLGFNEGKAEAWQAQNTNSVRTTVFLHIGKTGGTFFKSLEKLDTSKKTDLFLGDHSDTLISTIKKFGQTRKLAFFFRPPEDRFVSGFNSRLRQGRPTYNVVWTAAEAAAFSFFNTPNGLAEALFSKDEHRKSAARFAMASIFHLKHNYSHFLHSADAVRYEAAMKNIVVCCETNQIDKKMSNILDKMGISLGNKANSNRNSSPRSSATELSQKAKENLKRFWACEYEIYEACKSVAKDLAFDN
jgi:hypothetical protein